MFTALQKLYPDIVEIAIENTPALTQRWRGSVYVQLPYTQYEPWLAKLQIASSNYCLTFAMLPLLLNHELLYNYMFYQSQLLIFPQDNTALCISGFYKKLPYSDLVKLYDLGKLYINNTYKKVKD